MLQSDVNTVYYKHKKMQYMIPPAAIHPNFVVNAQNLNHCKCHFQRGMADQFFFLAII